MSRTLVAYYSMSGNTRSLARELGASLGADVEEIVEPRARQGALGYVRGVFESLTRRTPPIAPPVHDPAQYDLVLMGGPVWAGHIASPMRTFASRYGGVARHVGFFCTEGGRGSETAFEELEQICKHPPDATLVVDAKHLSAEAHQADVNAFTSRLRTLQ
jgi:flavodoxin